MLAKSTVEKYHKLKAEYKLTDYVFCFQNGIFFNIIGEDAERFSEILGLKKQINEDNVAYIGFPTSALEKYVGRIILNRFNIAVFGKTQSFSNREGLVLKAKYELS